MGKKKAKSTKKRARRRERAKMRDKDQISEEIESQEAEADAAVKKAAKVEPESQPARVKKEPKAQKEREEPGEHVWERIKRFFGDVKIEAMKINWPSTDETWKSTWVTVFVIIVLSIFMGFCSAGFQKVSEVMFGVQTQVSGNPASVPTTPLENLTTAPPEEGSSDNGEGGTE